MRKTSFELRRNTLVKKTRLFLSAAILALLTIVSIQAQDLTSRPDRGLTGKGTQQTSNIDSINLQNGSVSLAMPLASLPPVAGGKLAYTLTAHYNSSLYNTYRSEKEGQSSPPSPCTPKYSTQTVAKSNTTGGWRIGGGYDVFFRDAHDDYNYLSPLNHTCDGAEYDYMQGWFFKPILVTPDGSEHEMRMDASYDTYSPLGGRDHLRNYYRYTGTGAFGFGSPTRFHTVDGSFISVVVNPPSSAIAWTMYMPDGTRVEKSADGQRTIDMNGNSILYGTNTAGGYAFAKDEQTGREIKWSAATYNSQSATKIEYQTVGGVWETVWVVWGTTTVKGKIYTKTAWNTQGGANPDDPSPCLIYEDLVDPANGNGEMVFNVAREIIMPATEPNVAPQKYTFAYNSDTTVQATEYNVKRYCVQTTTDNYARTASTGLGELSRMTTPTGATIDYKYRHDNVHKFGDPATPSLVSSADEILKDAVTEKKVTHDGAFDVWNYTVDTSLTATSSAVANPDGSSYSEQYYPVGFKGSGNQGLGGLTYRTNQSGKVMTEKHWTLLGGLLNAFGSQGDTQRVTFNPVVDTEYTSLLAEDGVTRLKMTAKKFQYDYNGQLTQTIEYDWFDPSAVTFTSNNYPTYGVPAGVPASASVLRTINNSYYNQAADAASTNAYQNRAVGTSTVVLGALQETTVANSGSDTRFSYDGQTYGTAPTKGNPTQISVWNDTNSTWINSGMTYDSYGNVITQTDPKGNITQIFYEDLTHAMPTKVQVDPQNGTGLQTTTTTYDFSTGAVLSTTDINGNTSSVSYTNLLLGAVDPFARVGTTYSPYINIDGVNKRLTSKTYYEDSTRKTRVESDLYAEGDAVNKTRESRDQLGRPILTERNENGANTYTISSETVYNAPLDRTVMSSNPHRATATTTDGWTRVKSDILGRGIEAATFSGALQPPVSGTNANWTGSVTTVYSLNQTTVTDQAGKQRRSVTNAIGQLTRVDEPNNSGQLDVNGVAAQSTAYVYDALGNLTTVNQGVQTRNFSYSSLSRLTSANNPESGTISYLYDNNGNLTTKTDARGVATTYAYDALNRVTNRSYSAPANLANYQASLPVTYVYDNLPNAKGRLTKVVTGTGSTPFSVTDYQAFDKLGRVTQSQQTTDGTAPDPMTYTYNLSGALIEQKYPSGRVVKNVLDADGDLSIVQSKKNANSGYWNYAKSFTYTAAGAVSSMQLGNGKWESAQFNSRLQPVQIALGTVQNGSDKLKLNFDYGAATNNGNVLSQQITVPTTRQAAGFTTTQNYTYDELNRLQSATETTPNQTGWKQTFTYDRYGNRNFDTANGNTTTLAANCQTAVCNPTVDPATNKLVGYTFDNAGNTKVDATGRQFTYDSENKQTEVKSSGNASVGQYFYDGDGKRVKKFNPQTQETTIFIYDAGGKMVAEYSTTVEPVSTAQVSYLTSDHLGSPRINTDANGAVTARHDYMPFGEEIDSAMTAQRSINYNYGGDTIRQKFTAYERDNETDLDYAQARMYVNKLGRFTTIDPLMASAKTMRPESWNRYIYCYNNPLTLVDPTGMDVQLIDEKARQRVLSTLPEELRKKVEKQISKNGLLKKGALDKIVSKNANFKDLKTLVNSAKTVEVMTSDKYLDGSKFTFISAEMRKQQSIEAAMKDGQTREEAESEIAGLEENDTKGLGDTEELANGNFRVILSDGTGDASTAPVWALAGVTAHELYGHALSGVEGKPWKHETIRNRNGDIIGPNLKGSVNIRTRRAEERTENMYKTKGNIPSKKP